MKKRGFLWGTAALLLTLALIFTACDTSATEVEGTVGISSQDTPDVTPTAVKGGVLLEWNPILDATYVVWRKESGEDVPEAIRLGSPPSQQNPKTGKVYYLDLVSDDNELEDETEYIYTVIARGNLKTDAKAEVRVTTGDIPAKGEKLAAVSGVTLVLDQEAEEITVSWTEPAGEPADVVPSQYYIVVSSPNFNSNTLVSFGETSASFPWSSSQQFDGEYTAWVVATSYNGSSTYFKQSDIAASKQQFVALFGSGNPSIGSIQPIITTNTITGFTASITFGGVKPEVVYSVERADIETGTYAVRSVYDDPNSLTALPPADLTGRVTEGSLPQDVVGIPHPTVYDKGLELGKTYKYRIKATKGTATQFREISSTVTTDPRNYSFPSITIGAATTSGNNQRYAVTPSIYKNALQTGDKLVIYYVKGNSSSYPYNLYQDTYTKGIEFNKTELEAATGKNLDIPQVTGDDVAYVQAYIVFADGRTPQNVTSYNGGGVNSGDWYNPGGGTAIYYAQLNY
jgi:hypothetical protein